MGPFPLPKGAAGFQEASPEWVEPSKGRRTNARRWSGSCASRPRACSLSDYVLRRYPEAWMRKQLRQMALHPAISWSHSGPS